MYLDYEIHFGLRTKSYECIAVKSWLTVHHRATIDTDIDPMAVVKPNKGNSNIESKYVSISTYMNCFDRWCCWPPAPKMTCKTSHMRFHVQVFHFRCKLEEKWWLIIRVSQYNAKSPLRWLFRKMRSTNLTQWRPFFLLSTFQIQFSTVTHIYMMVIQ